MRRTKGENHEVLFHHRYATSTVDIRNACHPFSTKEHFESQYIGVHNGVLYNDDKLQKEHKELGIEYVSTQPNGTFNDSEALIYDLARYFEGQVEELTAAGSIAFIVVKRDESGKPMTLFFGHNSGNPLKMKKTEHSITISSEGDGDLIPVNQLHIFDYETKELRTKYMYIPTSSYTYSGYSSGYSQNSVAPKSTYGSWEDYLDGDDDGDSYVKEMKQGNLSLEDYKERMNEDFAIRLGDKQKLREDFLKENGGKKNAASLSAELEYENARAEMKLMDGMIASETDEETQEAIIEYWCEANDYSEKLREVADELYTEAKAEAEAEILAEVEAIDREDKGKQPFGFHAHRHIKQGGLLPATTQQNTNDSGKHHPLAC